MSKSPKKSKLIKDWITLHPNVVKSYTVENNEHRLELADHCAIKGNEKVIQNPSAELTLWKLHNLIKIEEDDELPF